MTGHKNIGAIVRLQNNFGVGREDCVRSIITAPISSNTWNLACNTGNQNNDRSYN